MIRTVIFRTANELNGALAQLMGEPFGFTMQVSHPGDPLPAVIETAALVFDIDSANAEQAPGELIRGAATGLASCHAVALYSKTLDQQRRRALARRGVMVYRRLDEGLFHDLAWKLGKKASRLAA